ncbi:hypothetical protein F8M41_016543 [Gigaspora margarita]|uniref:Uncharacterized protein n=1 Tax=Gigaspora margarita TaxID=4874 RepID=A0A8H4EUN7_GIGMA|nr:hypothetical protein F8M41_016543 [Gigaspora margarita]
MVNVDGIHPVGPCYKKGNGIKKEDKLEKGINERNESGGKGVRVEKMTIRFELEEKYETGEKELTIMEVVEVDYTSDTYVTHKSTIENKKVKPFEWYMRSAEDGFATEQFNPGGPYDQNGVSLKHACKS